MLKARKLFKIGSDLWICTTTLLFFVFAVSASAQQSVTTRRLIFSVVEQPPAFPGGSEALDKYLATHLKYPEEAGNKYRNKTVFANFIVTETGTIDSVHILKPVHDAMDAEVVRVIENMPAWMPGKQNGHTVAVRYNLPVRFSKK